MRVLILDDMKERHEKFASLYAGHEITHVYKFHEA